MNSRLKLNTHWLVSITAMLQVVCVLDQSLKVSAPHSRNFLNIPTTFDLLFLSKQWFPNKKIWLVDVVLRWIFDRKLISPDAFRDVQKPLSDLCRSQFFIVLTGEGEIGISFSSHKISLCSKLPHFDGLTLNNFGCVYLKEMHAQWSSHFCIWKREAVVV